MAISRRNFLKAAAGSGLLLAAEEAPDVAAQQKELPPEAVGILYDATLCIGCKSCMVNCKKYNSMKGGALDQGDGSIPYEHITPEKIYDAPTRLSAKSLEIIKAYKNGTGLHKDTLKDGFSFVKIHCMHCLEPACVAVCPVGALQKDPRTGAVFYQKDSCIGCRYCQMACPFGIPQFEWARTNPQIRKCQLCRHRFQEGKYSACCEYCPTGASIFGPVKALREEAQRRLTHPAGEEYDFPVQRVDAKFTSKRPMSRYVNHLYGLHEAGGTQYMLLAGIPFQELGFNPNISDEAYPELTWAYIKKVPPLIAVLITAGVASYLLTRNRDANPEGKKTDQER
ncbi:MAG: hydrogenase 2 operon protein HybA [Deltaproteobacteria bacterium]